MRSAMARAKTCASGNGLVPPALSGGIALACSTQTTTTMWIWPTSPSFRRRSRADKGPQSRPQCDERALLLCR